jgi:hypothetical protein
MTGGLNISVARKLKALKKVEELEKQNLQLIKRLVEADLEKVISKESWLRKSSRPWRKTSNHHSRDATIRNDRTACFSLGRACQVSASQTVKR